MKYMSSHTHFWLWTTLLSLGCMLILIGCPASQPKLQMSSATTQIAPEEKVYALTLNTPLKVSIEDNEAMVYRFEAQIAQGGLYQFETQGNVDTLCALVQGRGANERFVLVRDLGGKGDNCKLLWSLPPGQHRFKVRVDGRGSYNVKLHPVTSKNTIHKTLQHSKTIASTLNTPSDLHRYTFVVPTQRLVQIKAKGQGVLQCILREKSGKWHSSHDFRHPYGTCSIHKKLPPGQYTFELRGNRPDIRYSLLYQQIRMQRLMPEQIKEGFLHKGTFDIYEVNLRKGQHHTLQTHGRHKLRCSLEQPLGHTLVEHQTALDNRNCRFTGQFSPGRYYLRVRLIKPSRQGLYQVSFQQSSYTELGSQTDQLFLPDFHRPFQFFKLKIPHARLYQIEVKGRPVHCQLQSKTSQSVPAMNLSEPERCLLFVNFQKDNYFLKITPTTRSTQKYKVRIVQYKPSSGSQLFNERPLLLGPLSPKTRKTFKIETTQPELIVLETRGRLDTSCTLYESSGSKLAHDDDNGKRLNCKIIRYLKPGSYRLNVQIVGSVSGLFWLQRKRRKLPWIQLKKANVTTITSKESVRTFMLRVHKTGLYGFHTESALDTICTLLDSEWNKVAKDDDSGTQKNCFLAKLLTPGVYSIQVKLYRNQKGKIKLFANRLGLKQMKIQQPIASELTPPNWMNFYKVEVHRPGLYVLQTKGQLDTRCALLNQQSKQIANNDDTSRNNKNCQIIENLQTGIYFFQVWLYKGKRKSFTGPLQYRALYQEKKASIVRLKLNKNTRAELRPQGITRFLIKIKKPGLYSFTTTSQLDPKCVLLDPFKRQIAKDDDSGRQRNCQINRRLKPGLYELQVRPATSSRNNGPYKVGVFTPGN